MEKMQIENGLSRAKESVTNSQHSRSSCRPNYSCSLSHLQSTFQEQYLRLSRFEDNETETSWVMGFIVETKKDFQGNEGERDWRIIVNWHGNGRKEWWRRLQTPFERGHETTIFGRGLSRNPTDSRKRQKKRTNKRSISWTLSPKKTCSQLQ